MADVRVVGASVSMTTILTDNFKNSWYNDILSFESATGIAKVLDKKLEEYCEN